MRWRQINASLGRHFANCNLHFHSNTKWKSLVHYITFCHLWSEEKKQTKRYDQLFQLPGLQNEWTRKILNMFLSEFKLFCANMPTWLKSGSSAGSMEAAAKSPLSPHILPSSYLYIVFFNKDETFRFWRVCVLVQMCKKKNLLSCEKSKGAFLMSVVLPEYLMRLTPEKTW